MARVLIAALYHFVTLEDFEALRPVVFARASKAGIQGTLLLAREGLNGTIAGDEPEMRQFLAWLRADPRLAGLVHKESWADEMPFVRLKVRLKKEIVTIGLPEVDPTALVGTYVKPKDWNALISDPDVVLVDTRNDYEVDIGTFKGAIDPRTASFTEFPAWSQVAPELKGRKKVAMFCTGGIRCEKASSYLLSQGVEQVFHLEGGILKYLEEVPASESMWEGDCYVFDRRVSVDHDLQPGTYVSCAGCRRPVSEAQRTSDQFIKGVCCPACHDELTAEQRERFAERQKQLELARQRGERFWGKRPPEDAWRKRRPALPAGLPVLYSARREPGAMWVRRLLEVAGLQVELREVVGRDLPEALLEISGSGEVPVLASPDGSVRCGAPAIASWVIAQGGLTAWAAELSEATELLEVLYGAETWRTNPEPLLGALEERLAGQTHLSGEAPGLVDAAAFPVVLRVFKSVEGGLEARFPRLASWLDGERDGFRTVMKKFRKWHPEKPGVLFPPTPQPSV